jgi:serine/threonine protein kinase
MKNVILADAGGGVFVATWLVIAVIACFIAIQIKRRTRIHLGIFGIILEKFGFVLEKIGEKKIPAPPAALPTQTISRKCPQCGAELKPDVSEGLCPACLLQRGIATEGGVPPGTPPFVPPTIPDLARLFPQLEILELIGQGGMGAVYKARQPALDRFVALKILAPRSGGDLDFAERFTREARALAKLSHPNIVAVYDFGRAELSTLRSSPATEDGPLGQDAQQRVPTTPIHYFIMEYVDGPNLRQVEQAGKLSPREALEIIPQICAALQFAHDEGIVHRDIKPENILLDKKGRVKIADFGLAKILGQEPNDLRLTGARDIMGTPHYMAPEQVEKPQTVDHRADIYSLGVVFYEMLTGELPLGKFQPPSQKVQVDVRLDEVVLRALAKEPELRYQNVSEIKTRVETIASTNAPAAAPAMSAGEILARDYALNIRRCLRRGWALVRNDFWPLVGISAFVLVVLSAASSSEVVVSSGKSHTGTTSILGILLSGPLMGGLYLYFLKKIRREAAGVETAFTGFRHPFPHLVIAGFLTSLLTALGFLCLILPGVYLFVAWIFTFPLIVDQRLDFWPAMQLSRKIISKHWWKFLGFLIVLALINLAGLATCCVGLFITFPITFAALAYAYEDIPGATASPPGASSSIPSSAPPTPPTPPPDRFWRRFAVTVLALIILVPVGILTLGVLLPVVAQRQIEKHEHNAVQTLAEQPPVVVETWPVSGARNVEPGIAEIRVRFSKEMTDGSWSWSTAWENSTPETVGQIHYETDQRTCVLKAKLEPGRTYAWWLNSDKFKNFTDIAGRPAVPYLLIFQTKPN